MLSPLWASRPESGIANMPSPPSQPDFLRNRSDHSGAGAAVNSFTFNSRTPARPCPDAYPTQDNVIPKIRVCFSSAAQFFLNIVYMYICIYIISLTGIFSFSFTDPSDAALSPHVTGILQKSLELLCSGNTFATLKL